MLVGMRRASSYLDGVMAAPGRQECPQADRQYASNGHQQQRPLLQGPQHAPVREAPPCSARAGCPSVRAVTSPHGVHDESLSHEQAC